LKAVIKSSNKTAPQTPVGAFLEVTSLGVILYREDIPLLNTVDFGAIWAIPADGGKCLRAF